MEIMDQDKIALPKKVRKFRMKATIYALEITVFEYSWREVLRDECHL